MLPPIEHRIAAELGVRPAQVNAAIDHLRAGKARYRVVLDASK